MDCSSPNAMASLIRRKDEYDLATGNDADADRHGIVTPDARADEPQPLPGRRDRLPLRRRPRRAGRTPRRIGKTLVSSSMIDRVAESLGKPMVEVPVGFKWFVPGLIDGSFGFGGEESAGRVVPAHGRLDLDHRQGRPHPGAAGLRDPGPHGTDAEPALRRPGRRARRPGVRPDRRPGRPEPRRPSSAALSPDDVTATELAGEEITAKLTEAPGNGAKIGGLKVTTESRVVRRPPVGHRGRLQDLRRVVPRPRPPRPGAGGGPRGRLRRPGLTGHSGALSSR